MPPCEPSIFASRVPGGWHGSRYQPIDASNTQKEVWAGASQRCASPSASFTATRHAISAPACDSPPPMWLRHPSTPAHSLKCHVALPRPQMLYVMTNPDFRMGAYSRLSSLMLWTFVALNDREPGDTWVPEARFVVFPPFEQVRSQPTRMERSRPISTASPPALHSERSPSALSSHPLAQGVKGNLSTA
jgi:hypothetical protein